MGRIGAGIPHHVQQSLDRPMARLYWAYFAHMIYFGFFDGLSRVILGHIVVGERMIQVCQWSLYI